MRIALSLLPCVILCFLPSVLGADETPTVDVVVYGNTAAGIVGAVQAKRMGKSVLVVGPDKHLGGLSSGGLGWTASGKKDVIGGVSRELYQRVKKYYDQPQTWNWQKPGSYSRYRPKDDAQWTFEPHVAEQVFEDLAREYRITVHRDQWLNRKSGEGVEIEDGEPKKDADHRRDVDLARYT